MNDKQQEYVDGLRELADYLETTELDVFEDPVRLDVFAWTEEKFRVQSHLLGGKREKVLEGSYAITRRNFGPHTIDVNISREKVCEKVQTGTRLVPAQEAVEEHEEPVYEWQCEGFTVIR